MPLDKPLLIEFREHSMAAFERSALFFQFQILASYRGERRIYSTYINREPRAAKRRRLLQKIVVVITMRLSISLVNMQSTPIEQSKGRGR